MFTYENLGTTTYLVYELKENETVDTMSLGMLSNNKIDGILPVIFTQMDTKRYIKFNVSAKVAMNQFFTGMINRKNFLNILSGIIDALMIADEYMIDPNSFILDQQYIFIDLKGNVHMACLPVIGDTLIGKQYLAFFKQMVFNTRLDESENSIYFTKIVNYLNSNTVLALDNFKKLVDGLKQEAVSVAPVNVVRTDVNDDEKDVVVVDSPVVPIKIEPVEPVGGKIPNVDVPSYGQGNGTADSNGGVDIPGNDVDSDDTEEDDEGKISLYALLRNFSKENLELYKAQKSKKKGKGGKESGGYNGVVIPGQDDDISQIIQPNINISPDIKPPHNIPDITPDEPKKPPKGPVLPDDYSNTVLIDNDDIEDTTYMGNEEEPVNQLPYLKRMINLENIYINKPFFRIGQKKYDMDYTVTDNKAVSHEHAVIIQRSTDYYIIDTKSKNHTYIDGTRINSNEEYKLEHGAKVRLANEEFEFYLY